MVYQFNPEETINCFSPDLRIQHREINLEMKEIYGETILNMFEKSKIN